MGQKVNSNSIRIGINSCWLSSWYASGPEYLEKIRQDIVIRSTIMKKMQHASVSKIFIERAAKKTIVNIHSSRPGLVIGKKGSDIDKIKSLIVKITGYEVQVNIAEVKKMELEATLVASSITRQLEKRVSFRKVIKRAISSSLKAGALGIRVNVKGRLGGSEIARMEWYKEGRVPLHTFKANIKYASSEALTCYGIIGIKVWIYVGDKS